MCKAQNRSCSAGTVAGFLAFALFVACAPTTDSPEAVTYDIGERNQVFIDGRYLDSASDVRITVNQPVKTNEQCLVGDLRGYETVLEPDGTFRGFHALTKDGVRWRRVEPGDVPEPDDILGLYNGQRVPFVDPLAEPEERYKLFSASEGEEFDETVLRASADGAEWREIHRGLFPKEAVYPRGMDSQNVAFYDTRINRYAAYVRVNLAIPAPPHHQPYFDQLSLRNYGRKGYYFLRSIGRAVTDDLSKFPMPEVVLQPDEQDPRFDGAGVMDFYTPQVIPYPHAQDAYYLFTARYLHYEDWFLREDLSGYPLSGADTLNTGTLDIGFAASRNGMHWERYQRRPWIPLGPEGSFDSKAMYSCRGLTLRGDEIWLYYIGYDRLHGDAGRRERSTPVMSRVVIRKDGFTSVEAEYEGGEFTTPPLRFEGDRLSLNVDTSALGLLRVEIQDQAGQPIPGFSLEDCDRIHTTNSTRKTVRWRKKADVGPLAGQAVRLRFELRYGVKLHAFQFSAQ